MKVARKLVLLALSLIIIGCSGKQNGYSDLDELYADLVVYLKDPNEENLKAYCRRISPDQSSIDYMKKNDFSYRGIPDDLEKQGIDVSVIGDECFNSILSIKEKLMRRERLDDLTYLGREHEGEELFEERLGIYATETSILMESNGQRIEGRLMVSGSYLRGLR